MSNKIIISNIALQCLFSPILGLGCCTLLVSAQKPGDGDQNQVSSTFQTKVTVEGSAPPFRADFLATNGHFGHSGQSGASKNCPK